MQVQGPENLNFFSADTVEGPENLKKCSADTLEGPENELCRGEEDYLHNIFLPDCEKFIYTS